MTELMIITIGTSKETEQKAYEVRMTFKNLYYYAFGNSCSSDSLKSFIRTCKKRNVEPTVIISQNATYRLDIIEALKEMEVAYYDCGQSK